MNEELIKSEAEMDNDKSFWEWFRTKDQEELFSIELAARDGFLAAAKLKDVRINELKTLMAGYACGAVQQVQLRDEEIKALEEKLKVAELEIESLIAT